MVSYLVQNFKSVDMTLRKPYHVIMTFEKTRCPLFLMILIIGPLIPISAHKVHTRIKYGSPDMEDKYPFVVAILAMNLRVCTGTLLTIEWVLTAAHCVKEKMTEIQYGDMRILPYQSRTKSPIIQKVRHPGFRMRETNDIGIKNDIGLLRVKPVFLNNYGKLSAVDYTWVIGHDTEDAGYVYYGYPEYHELTEDIPLQLGFGVAVTCEKAETRGPFVCVVPKRSNKFGISYAGDCGGPVFYDGKVVGVLSWGRQVAAVNFYTAVSPFLTWIHNVTVAKTRRSIKKRSISTIAGFWDNLIYISGKKGKSLPLKSLL